MTRKKKSSGFLSKLVWGLLIALGSSLGMVVSAAYLRSRPVESPECIEYDSQLAALPERVLACPTNNCVLWFHKQTEHAKEVCEGPTADILETQ